MILVDTSVLLQRKIGDTLSEPSDFLNLRRWHGIIYYPSSVEPLLEFPAKVDLSQEASPTSAQMRIAVTVLPAATQLETAALSESRFALGTRP